MPSPGANSTWFHFFIPGGPEFAVFAFSGVERVSRPYSFTVDLASLFTGEQLFDLVGQEACLSIADRSGASRLVHGVIREMQQLHAANLRTCYRCILVPRLWFLDSRRNHRIFQYKSVPDIITHILGEQNFTGDSFTFKCFHDYPAREYCVQYGESDLHFISRLCEEEGIYYYFEHSESGHCLCFSDMPGGPRICGESDLRYSPGSGQTADTAVVSRATLCSQSVSDRATLRDWNFLTPSSLLEGSASEPDFPEAPTASGLDTEIYAYPHSYQNISEAGRYADIQLRRQLALQTWLEAGSDVSRFLPGFTFSLHGHDLERLNAGWWITGVTHRGEQPQVLEHEAPDRGMLYASTVTAIPENVRYVPETAHSKKRVMGTQTALVTGLEGEEIYPDKYGRVKVQFFWDREGTLDENTSCWIRASQGWAGTEFGTQAIPRIGHEVIVSFLEGDPDRPVITGRAYHGGNMPPYELPDSNTRTVFKSMSTPGDDGPRGFNELRIKDRTGEEEIYVHAEKDVNIHVKNDWKKHVLRDRHQTTDRNTHDEIQGETHVILKEHRKTELFSDDHLTVHADSHARVEQQWLMKAGAELHIETGQRMLLEAGSELTVRAGGSWLKVDAAGVRIQGGRIDIMGDGKAGNGTPARPLTPVPALRVNQGEAPDAALHAPAERKEEKLKSDGELRIGVFFDGSGAHKDKPGDPYTNIAKLHDCYRAEKGKYYKIYAHGVGVKDGSYGWDVVSLACGTGGEGANADDVWSIVFEGFLARLNEVDLSTVKRITLDVFGFSRGASLARHFVNAVQAYGLPHPAVVRTSGNMPHQYRDIVPNMLVQYDPVGQYNIYEKLECETVIGFVGLFDTVGAFYWPQNLDEGNFKLLLPAAVLPRTYQIAAADEYREIYALYDLKASAQQDDMPGCHSDIGGGYAISDAPEDKGRNRHDCSYVYLGKAIVNTEFGRPDITQFHLHGDPQLRALCRKLLEEFIEMETARRAWRSFPSEKTTLYTARREKAGLSFATVERAAGKEYEVNIFKIKEELIDLRYVCLFKMHQKARSFGVPLKELKSADVQAIPAVLDLAKNDYHKFWERYIHLSAVGYATYAHCYTVTPDGVVILRPELAPDQLPRTAFPSLRPSTLAMGTAEDCIRPSCDNNGNVGKYIPSRLPLPASMEGLS